jgi:hypothetical protein
MRLVQFLFLDLKIFDFEKKKMLKLINEWVYNISKHKQTIKITNYIKYKLKIFNII